MHKLVVFLLMFFSCQQMWGQSNSNQSRIEMGFSSKAGVFDLPHTFVSRDVPLCIEGCWISGSKPSLEVSAGVEARYKLANWLWVSSGINYSRSSYYEEFTGSDGANYYTNLNKRNFDFLNIPLLANAPLYFLAGRSVGIFGEFRFINHINMTITFPDPESDIKLKRYGISGTIGAGLLVSKSRFTFAAGPYFTHSLTSFGNDIPPSDRNRPDSSNSDSNKFTPYSTGIKISAFVKL